MALKDERSIGVNIAAHFDEGSLLNATKRIASMVEVLKQEMNSSDFHNYYKDVDALAKAVENAYRAFESNRNPDSALNLVKAFNALAALDKNKLGNLSDLMPDLSGAVDSAKDLAGALANAFREENFREAFAAFDSIKENGGDVIKLFERIGQSAESTEELRSTIRRLSEAYTEAVGEADELRERVKALEDDSSVGMLTKQLEEAEGELSRLRSTAVEEFRAYLRSNDINPFQTDTFGDRVFNKYFDQIREGSMTAKQAIAEVKKEFASLFDDRDSGVGADALGAISVRLDDILRKYEELSIQIREAGAAAPMERIGEAAETGASAIERQGETIREVTSQKSVVNDLNDLIKTLVSISQQAEGSASSLYEQIIPLVQSVKDLSDVDTNKLRNLAGIFEGLSGLNGFKVTPQQIGNLNNILSTVSRAGDLGNLTKLSGLRFDGLNNIKIDGRGLSSFDKLVTILDKFAKIDPGAIEKIAKMDFSSLGNLKAPEISNTALTSLEKMSDAMIAAKEAANAMTGMLETAGTAAAQSGKKITDALSQGPIGGNDQLIGINKTLKRSEELINLIGRARNLGFDQAGSSQVGNFNSLNYQFNQYEALRKSVENGTISQKQYNDEYRKLESITQRVTKSIRAAVAEAEKEKQITEKEFHTINAAWEQRDSVNGWTDAEILDAGIQKQEEYIANLRKIDELEDARIDGTWRNEINAFDTDEINRENAEINAQIEATYKEQERLLAEKEKREMDYLARKMEAEKKAAEQEERRSAKADIDVYEDSLREIEAIEKENAAEAAREAMNTQAAERYIANEKRKQEASKMTADQAEAELTRLKSLRIDFQNQIDKADELGIDGTTVDSLREQIAGIDRLTPILEGIASKQGDMTLGMDAYKDAIKRAKDQLTLLKKQLSGEIQTAGAFTPMTGNQVGIASRTINTKRTSLEKEIAKATDIGLGDTDQVNTLRNLISLYDRLEEQVQGNAISQDQYSERMRLFKAITEEVNGTLNDDIKNIDALGNQYDELSQEITAAQGAINGAWAEATDGQKEELASLNTEMATLAKAWQDGTIDGKQLETVLNGISDSYKKLDESVQREYETRKRSHEIRMRELSVQINANSEINKGSKLLRDYSAAEHSKNESSRAAYVQISNSIHAIEDLNEQYTRGDIDLARYEEEVKKYSRELEVNSAIIRRNGDDHLTAFGKIGRAIKTHLTTLTATASIGSIMRYIRQMVDAVREIDTAMTELRKVTDETDSRYERFLDNAATRAKNLSATISDTVSATAEFARLGLSIDQAEKAADAAIVYKAVGDDIASINDAAESIISTMKAFGIEAGDAMSIVDKFNKVGKELCPAA